MAHYEELLKMGIPWEKMRNSHVLVTGGNGLIASSLIDALIYANRENKLGMKVYALCRNGKKAEERFAAYVDSEDFQLLIQDVIDPLDESFRRITMYSTTVG